MQSGKSTTETNRILQGTDSKAKNEMLFSQFGINYNNLSAMFRKGSVLVRSDPNAAQLSSETSDTSVRESTVTTSTISTLSSAGAPAQGLENEADDENSTPDVAEIDEKGSGVQVVRREKRPKKVRPYEGLTGEVQILHEDIIGDKFWLERKWLLA